MMNLLTIERCRGDGLHLMSEGIGCDVVRQMFQSKLKAKELSVSRRRAESLEKTLDRFQNYTNASSYS
ncbi:unnamed protein product [Heligmosomoides polygyrus]|uniref:Transposase n=1 Tax=Heligmosomoides polygyrus TaxID=6339 RepID=A0A183F8H0_HELPZ|nr:unnamed protein product [Heligmosomoides polygyrus]